MTYSLVKFPIVWSSFCKINVPAFGLLVSGTYNTFFSSSESSHLHVKNRIGALLISVSLLAPKS